MQNFIVSYHFPALIHSLLIYVWFTQLQGVYVLNQWDFDVNRDGTYNPSSFLVKLCYIFCSFWLWTCLVSLREYRFNFRSPITGSISHSLGDPPFNLFQKYNIILYYFKVIESLKANIYPFHAHVPPVVELARFFTGVKCIINIWYMGQYVKFLVIIL